MQFGFGLGRFGRRDAQLEPASDATAAASEPAMPVIPGGVSLVKGSIVSLVKDDGTGLEAVRMGLGWLPTRKGGYVDLDANCSMFELKKRRPRHVETVSFSHLISDNQSVRHSGDDLTGQGGAPGKDNESITVDLKRLPAGVNALYFTVNSFSGQSFGEVRSAHCRLVAQQGGRDVKELGIYTLSDMKEVGHHRALIMARVVLGRNGLWRGEMIGEPAEGRVARDLEGVIAAHLSRNPIA